MMDNVRLLINNSTWLIFYCLNSMYCVVVVGGGTHRSNQTNMVVPVSASLYPRIFDSFHGRVLFFHDHVIFF